MRKILVFLIILPFLAIFSAPLAFALECPVLMEPAQIAIDQATTAMKLLPEDKQATVQPLITDAKMLLHSAKLNCAKPAAGDFDLARAQAEAGAATAFAEAAKDLAKNTDCTDPPNLVPGANLVNCDLSLGALRGTNLRGTNLTGANMRGAIMYNAKLRDVNLSGATLISADLTGANLTGANLTKTDLTFARLGANLTRANLRGTNLTGANVAKARWSNTTCPDGTNSNDPDGDGGTCLNNF